MNKKIIKTMCARNCHDSCFLTAIVDENGKLESLRGDAGTITNGFTCPRGAKDLSHLYTNRVSTPQVRVNGKSGKEFRQMEWDVALSMVAKKLEDTISKHGKDSVLLLDYSGNCGLITSTYIHRLWNALDSAFEGGSFNDLMDGKDMVFKCKPLNRYTTVSGKMEFASNEALKKGYTTLPVHRDLVLGEGEFILLNTQLPAPYQAERESFTLAETICSVQGTIRSLQEPFRGVQGLSRHLRSPT